MIRAIAGTTGIYGNDINNGQFRVAQAGTSFPAPTTGDYDLDGWLFRFVGAGVVTVSQEAGSSTGKLARRCTITTADASIAAGDYYASVNRIEGYNAVKYLIGASTVGVKVSAPVTGIHCLTLYNGTSSYVQEVDITVSDTPQVVVLNFPLTPVLASTVNAWGLEVRFTHACGSTFQTTADAWNAGDFYGTANQVNDMATITDVIELEGVTMNLGTAVAPDTRDYEADLAKAQRYLPAFNSGGAHEDFAQGAISSTSEGNVYYDFKVPPRIPPTGIALNNVTHFNLSTLGVANTVATALVFARASTESCTITLTGTGTPYTAGHAATAYANNAAGQILFTGAQL